MEQPRSEEQERAPLEARVDARVPFGPAFFAESLGGLVRHRCPDPKEALPAVQLHLVGGAALHICHIIEITPAWIALAVREEGSPEMRTELVPFETIVRVSVWGSSLEGRRVGFVQEAAPAVHLTPEQALQAAGGAQQPRAAREPPPRR